MRSAINTRLTDIIAETPAASPSSPSMKFTAFVIKTIHITVALIESHKGSTRYGLSEKRFGFVSTVILIFPPIITTKAASICIKNLSFALKFLQSSITPITAIIKAPQSVAIKAREKCAKQQIETVNPKIMAKPPSLGIGFLCIRLPSFGISIAPILYASLYTIGVDAKLKANATTNVSIRKIVSFVLIAISNNRF